MLYCWVLCKFTWKTVLNIVNFFLSFHHQEGWQYWQTDEKVRAEFFSRRFSGMHHTIWGWNDKELEDDIVVDVNPRNYEPWFGCFKSGIK